MVKVGVGRIERPKILPSEKRHGVWTLVAIDRIEFRGSEVG